MDARHSPLAVLLLLTACAAEPGRPAPSPAPDEETPDTTVQPRPSRPSGAVAADSAPPVADARGEDLRVAVSDAAAPDATATAADVANDGTPDAFAAADAPTSAAGCAAGHAVCLDFEGKALDGKWTGAGSSVKVETGKAAHGEYALHLAPLSPGSKRMIATSALGGITNVLWGRFYLWATPGLPNGHGALVYAYDQSNNFYELGFQFGAYHGNWHVPAGVPERWMNSKVIVPADRWVCVEFLFDGANRTPTKIWSDGVPVMYSQVASSPSIAAVTQFRKVELGFHAIHGTSLKSYEGSSAPATTDVWIDDVAFDTKRIGCIQ